MLSLRIAVRFLRTSPGQSILIIAGIAVGIAVQIFVGTLITSLQANLLDTTIGNASHVTLQNADDKKPLLYTPAIRRVLASDTRVKLIVPDRVLSVIFSKGTDSAPINVVGAAPSDINAIYKMKRHLVSGRLMSAAGDVILGKSFATKYQLKPGDPVLVVLPGGEQQKLTLVGIFDVGTSAVNDRIGFTTPDFPRRALGMAANEYSDIQMQLTDPFQSQAVIRSWEGLEVFKGVQFKDWQVENAQLLVGLQSQGSSSYMIQAFVLIAVALGIASTLAISAVQKTRQIGILKAMGLTDRRAGLVFLWEAAVLGGCGTLLGLVFGVGLLQLFALGPLTFPIVLDPAFVAGSCAIGVVVALLSAIIPSRGTSRLDPIEVIQGAG
jgi:lipoprotein-releasing system permease protein